MNKERNHGPGTSKTELKFLKGTRGHPNSVSTGLSVLCLAEITHCLLAQSLCHSQASRLTNPN